MGVAWRHGSYWLRTLKCWHLPRAAMRCSSGVLDPLGVESRLTVEPPPLVGGGRQFCKLPALAQPTVSLHLSLTFSPCACKISTVRHWGLLPLLPLSWQTP